MAECIQYQSLTACCPSLAFISLQDSAASSGMEPSGAIDNETFMTKQLETE